MSFSALRFLGSYVLLKFLKLKIECRELSFDAYMKIIVHELSDFQCQTPVMSPRINCKGKDKNVGESKFDK